MYKLYILLAVSVLLQACNTTPESLAPKSNQDIFNRVEGPTPPSLEQTMQKGAKSAFDQQDYDRAISFYKQLLQSTPDNAEYNFMLAESLRLNNQPREALALYSDILKKQPTNIPAKEGKALTLVEQGEFGTAIQLFSEVIAKEPTRWQSVNGMGVALMLTGRKEDAIRYYNQAQDIARDNPAILNNIALSLALSEKSDEAIEILEKLSRRLANNNKYKKKVDMNLALAYGISGDLDAAERIARKHLSEAAVYNNLGVYSKFHQENSLAQSYLTKALTASPVYYEKAWDNLAEVKNAN